MGIVDLVIDIFSLITNLISKIELVDVFLKPYVISLKGLKCNSSKDK